MNTAHPGPYAAIPVWLRPITRRPGEVQFGVLEGGPIVTGVTPDEARLLGRLDGTMPPDALDLVARASGVSRRRWRVLLDLVGRLGLLEPAATAHPDRSDGSVRSVRSVRSDRSVRSAGTASLAARTGSPVLVEGDGSLAADVRRLLETDAAAAPGPMDSDGVMDALDVTGDLGVTGDVGVMGVGAGGSGSAQPAAVVLVADIALDPRRGDLWLRRGVPHLPVVTTGSRAVVGPLVDGTPGAPCLWCLDLHRSDRDAAWPTVMAQVATVPVDSVAHQVGPRPAADPPRAGEPGLSHLVAGTVAALVARSLAGDPPPPGVAVEVTLPWPRIDHRRWPPHPRCRHRTSRLQGGGPTPGGTASAREPGRT